MNQQGSFRSECIVVQSASGSENIQLNDEFEENRRMQISLLNQSMLDNSLRFSSIISADLRISSKLHTSQSFLAAAHIAERNSTFLYMLKKSIKANKSVYLPVVYGAS